MKEDLPKGPAKNYFVPNFGVDEDVKNTLAHVEAQEKRLKHKWTPKQDENGYWIVPEPINNRAYTYGSPSLVQTDAEVKTETESDPMCSSAGCTYKNKAKHPMNYFVPNFGVDQDIGDNHESLDWAESNLNHTWIPLLKKDAPDAHPQNYFVPNFGVDEDIVDAQKNIATQEKKHGKWTPVQDDNGVWEVPEAIDNNLYKYRSLVQTDADIKTESDPICSSAGCVRADIVKKTHPMNYFVPNFGRDKNINETWGSLDWAETSLNHKWLPLLKKDLPKGHPMDYKVPDFGLDEDVVDTLDHVKKQEKRLKHSWKPVQDENGVWIVPEPIDNNSYKYVKDTLNVQLDADVDSDPICSSAGCVRADIVKKTHPMDYFVPNFGRDKNINETWASLDWAENSLKHHWVPTYKEDVKKDEHPMNYKVPDFGLDEDVVDTLEHVKNEEKRLKHSWKPVQDENGVWIVPEPIDNNSYKYARDALAQTEENENESQPMLAQQDKKETSDPICSSANWPCDTVDKKKLGYPIDYKVPNFGVDEDIVNTQAHIKAQEAKHGAWTPKQDENGAWSVPEPINNKSYNYKSLVQTDSDI